MPDTQTQIAPCYYPTRVILIDDNEEHLNLYSHYLKRSDIFCEKFTDPKKALEVINNTQNSNFWMRLMRHPEKTHKDSQNLLINLSSLWEAIYSFDRFNDLGVAIFDKQMPGMDGIRAIHENEQISVRCIMLTGYHDTNDLIELMTEGLIVGYIPKFDENSGPELIKTVQKAQRSYFAGNPHTYSQYLPMLPHLFNDENYIKLFHKLREQHNVIEHYVLDNSGSMLMLDKQGKAFIWAVFNKDDMDAIKFELPLADIEPSQAIIDAVTDEKKAPYFLHIDRYDIASNQWDNYWVDIQKGDGGHFHYAIITELEKYGIDANRIKSYEDFLKS